MAAADVAPRFGIELKDSFKPVNAWVAGGIEWLTDIQQFYRERSAIEKEYSTKLNGLAQKYFERKNRRTIGLSVGDTPTATPGSLESASLTTWTVQLKTLESRAAEHERFANELVSQLAEPLQGLGQRSEELRKQHADYAAKLEKERDGVYAELRKTKAKYDSECQDVENKRKKVESSSGDSSKQKAQASYSHQLSNMHNAKNSYLVNINVTNKHKERYYNEYVPEMVDSLQDLSEARVSKLNAIWTQAANIENTVLMRSSEYVKHLASEIPRNTPNLDSTMFIRHNIPNWAEPGNFTFEPSPVWLDDDAIIKTEAATTFLQNTLRQSKAQLSEGRREVDTKRKEVEGLRRTQKNVREGKENKDEVEVIKALFTLQLELHDAEKKKVTAEIEVATIIKGVGDARAGQRGHNFEAKTYKIPTSCDLCGDRLWGLSAKGLECKDCGYTCHKTCELKVPADCPGEVSKEEKRRLKAERQEKAREAMPVENAIPDRQASAPSLQRSDTINSMSTLSSGYSVNPPKAQSPLPPTPTQEDAADEAKPAETKSSASGDFRLKPGERRFVPPLPGVVGGKPKTNGAAKSSEPKAKMIYAYEQNADGEITVGEGLEVTIIEEDDGSGWTKIKAGRNTGFVPTAYMEKISAPSAASSAVKAEADRPSSFSGSTSSLAGSIKERSEKKRGPAVAPRRGAKKLPQVEAIYAYEARTDAEHSMSEGEKFVLVTKDTGDGWADVEKGGVVKSVPANYIQDV